MPSHSYGQHHTLTVQATVSLDTTGTLLKIVPSIQLVAKTQYCVYVNYNASGLQGSNGLAVPGTYQCFTTGTTSQTTPPAIVTVSPANNLSNVPVNDNLVVLFSGPVDPTTVNGTTISLSGGGQTLIPASISFSNSNQKVLIAPEAPLPASTLMTLTISGVTDVAGHAVTAQTTHFATGVGAATSALVLVTNPAASATGVPVNAAISLQTNTLIDPTTVNSSTFQVSDTTLYQVVPGTYSVSADDMTVYFVPAQQLAVGRTYDVAFEDSLFSYVGGITDLAGNILMGTCCVGNFSFTTGFAASTAAPQVTGVSPAAGLTAIPINAQIMVSLSEPVNGESLGGVTLAANGSAVGLSTVLSNGNQLLTITPSAAQHRLHAHGQRGPGPQRQRHVHRRHFHLHHQRNRRPDGPQRDDSFTCK